MLEPIAVPGGMDAVKRPVQGIREIATTAGVADLRRCQWRRPAQERFGGSSLIRRPRHRYFGRGLSVGFAFCGTVTTPEIAERSRGTKASGWHLFAGPLPSAVTWLDADCLADDLTDTPQLRARFWLGELTEEYECIGDIRAGHRMMDIVTDGKSKD